MRSTHRAPLLPPQARRDRRRSRPRRARPRGRQRRGRRGGRGEAGARRVGRTPHAGGAQAPQASTAGADNG
eukprot:39780-Pleurochrysis_carterae.AAC.1